MGNYYQTLGLEIGATQEEIKSAYRQYATRFHPDKQGGDPFFEERFKEIKEAYDALMSGNYQDISINNRSSFEVKIDEPVETFVDRLRKEESDKTNRWLNSFKNITIGKRKFRVHRSTKINIIPYKTWGQNYAVVLAVLFGLLTWPYGILSIALGIYYIFYRRLELVIGNPMLEGQKVEFENDMFVNKDSIKGKWWKIRRIEKRLKKEIDQLNGD